MSKTPASLPAAGLLRRLAALVYDAFLLFGLLVVPLFILAALRYHDARLANGAVVHDLPPIAPPSVMLLYIIGVTTGFYCYFWRRNGQTLGMQAWRLRVDSDRGGRPNWRQCWIRAAIGLLSLAIGGLGFLWLLVDRRHLAWHDRASGTHVVLLPKHPG